MENEQLGHKGKTNLSIQGAREKINNPPPGTEGENEHSPIQGHWREKISL